MLPRKIDDPEDGVRRHALEDLGGDLFGRVIVGMFKDRAYRQPGTLDQPGAGNLARDSLSIRRQCPVDHDGLTVAQLPSPYGSLALPAEGEGPDAERLHKSGT
jgi:hypothetical protein